MADGGVPKPVTEGAGKEEAFELRFDPLHVMRLPSGRGDHVPDFVNIHTSDLGAETGRCSMQLQALKLQSVQVSAIDMLPTCGTDTVTWSPSAHTCERHVERLNGKDFSCQSTAHLSTYGRYMWH